MQPRFERSENLVKISSLRIRNFRTLEVIDLDFPSSYAAICGPNDSGKTNIVRAVRALVKADSPLAIFEFADEEKVALKDDYPKWKDTKSSQREINFELVLSVERDRDAGFYQFLTKQLSIEGEHQSLGLALAVTYRAENVEPDVQVTCEGKRHGGIDAQQVLKQLQSLRSILFHNSAQIDLPPPFRGHRGGYFRATSPEHEALIGSMKSKVDRGLSRISRGHQKELEDLLGRLETKYNVALSMPTFDFASLPYRVTLGQKKVEVPLDDWGSGTRNRTLILLCCFAQSRPETQRHRHRRSLL